ncbi:MAG: hypothetical protein HN878_00540 [Candidatus Diapherotrites archaeon]|nr:hypothetical protein [Candidatus Diapherotrites archaeon]
MLTLTALIPFFLGLSELPGDMTFVLKIFVLMTIIAFVTQHLGKGPLAVLVIVVLSWFIVFDYFRFFGGVYVLYMAVTLGFSGILIDFFFVNPGSGQANEGGISNGKDFAARQSQIQRMMRR